MSQFVFLKSEWPDIFDASSRAEFFVHSDARTACFYARRSLELSVQWLYKHDPALSLPYRDDLSALIHEPTFRNIVGPVIFAKARLIKNLGNLAVHSHKPIRDFDALTAVRELFHVAFWITHNYARGAKPVDGLLFDATLLPQGGQETPQTVDQLCLLQAQLSEKDEKLSTLLADKQALDDELKRLRIEIIEVKKVNATRPDTHDYSEAETRDYFIDLLLKEAGWPLDQPQDREFEVAGMPNAQGKGYVDYVLWGDNGKPLAVVEAKRTKRDSRVGQQQAKLYADCLESQFGQRPVIFYSNGYEHWLWDDVSYPPRSIQGFYKKADLELLIQRRSSRKSLAKATINETIVERYYQTRAIRRIGEAFECDKDRKALLVMATGAGKTRTVVALVDLLIRCNWVKRVLFLADRVALVNQAVQVFKKHLPDSSPVNLVTEGEAEGRVFVSTYPTMMGLIDETQDGQKRFGIGHFDLVVIDEAHRSVFRKYRAIFDYFDSFLVGLTATPKDEVDRNTYSLFDLEKGVPTDAYSLEDAVKDKYLVPPKSVAVPLKFQREGINYTDLSDEEKEQWDALEWDDEQAGTPERVEAPAVNKWLFNKDTVDKVLEHLMTRGQKVDGGDRIGKTIIFAKNHAHAEFIAERFNANYPHYLGKFARVIDFQVEYVQSLINNFSDRNKLPHIAISIDMLDTGIDIPEIVNLVLFKMVRSKTKFWQMLGRGTRLCPSLFGFGEDKQFFYLFDYCQNLEFFTQNIETTDGSRVDSLGSRIFKARLELIGELEEKGTSLDEARVAKEILHKEVSAMNVNNFVVRPKRRLVEKYAKHEAWTGLTGESYRELSEEVAGLPSELESEPEEIKRFDLLMLRMQLALLRLKPSFSKLSEQLKEIACLLEEKASIPMVAEQMALILEIQTDEWWQDVTVPMLETTRKRLRLLIKLIEKQKRRLVYTDFEDLMGGETVVALPGFSSQDDLERFRDKARVFLREHLAHYAIHKIRMNESLNAMDLVELERMLVESGVGGAAEIEQAKEETHGLGLFVRSLVGLDREAAKYALAGFLSGKTLSANQIEFVNLIVDYLTEHGVMDPELLYESPFTDLTPQGPDAIFSSEQVDELLVALENVREMAIV